MRTTIELSNDQRSALHSLAAQKGLRGYSKLIQEAVDLYLKETSKKRKGNNYLLKMRGTWSQEEALRFREKLAGIRQEWKIT
jgi:metal-responsive CopG/Arc/MetJ family transcriptional regulator